MTLRGSLAALALLATPAAAAGDAIEPYKMVRSLQLVQDRLALGDHAAMPMQRKLLELTDERFRTAGAAEFDDPRNFRALMAYSISGGNPTTLEVVLSRLSLEGEALAIGRGVLAYMKGELARASQLLANVNPLRQDPETGAFLALLKGSILTAGKPAEALALMDQARLIAPGTLVEEAALRRSLSLCIALRDPECFLRAADRYTRRFLRSPYASEFADAFVEGVVTFHDAIGPDRIETIVTLMSPAQQEAIYLRLARRSTIKGQSDRSVFASEKAQDLSRSANSGDDPRATLYALMSSITSQNVADVKAQLEEIAPADLSPRDRRLLAAARAVTADVLAPPQALDPDTREPQETREPAPSRARAAPAAPSARNEPAGPTAGPGAVPQQPFPADGEANEPLDGSDSALVGRVRAKLEAIDRLLEERSATR